MTLVPYMYVLGGLKMEDTMQVNYRGQEIGEVDADKEKGNMDKDEYLYGAVIGRNFETMCLDITEPTDAEAYDDDNEVASTRQCQEREAYLQSVLASYRDYLLERSKHVLGYPSYIDNINSFGNLTQLQNIPINNVGDPFIASNYNIHSRQFEVAVLDWFARLWDLEKNQYWGYVSSGGTEGNYHGLLIGRELFPDAVLYASNDSHYSVSKAALMYRMEYAKIDTLVNGEMNYANFKTKLLLNKNKPAIVIVNIGTTVKGAVDDLDLVIRTLEEAGFTDDKFYIHCDGALFGSMLPFLQNSAKQASKLTFKKPIGSITISGHKFIGCPMPCGIQITRMEHIKTLSKNVEYLASRDATIMGSRNGHTPLFLWYALSRRGYKGFEKRVQKCLRNAQYLKDRLQAEGISAMLNEVSNTVVFERPKDEEFVRHWQLACEGNISHVVVMPSVDSKKLDAFVDELVKKRSIWYKDGNSRPPCLATTIGKDNCYCCLHK